MGALGFSIADQAHAIKAACTRFNVPIQVFMGMYNNETRLGSNVSNSSAGAVGPFQFTAADKQTGVIYPMTNNPTLSDFQQQCMAAAAYLAKLYTQLGNSWQNALAAYNAGPDNLSAGQGYASQALAFQVPANWQASLGSAPSTPIAGGTFGAGGTGTPGNQTSLSMWTVGDASHPDQDYWTTINQYSQSAQWYAFSDGETLFVADGVQLMAQTPSDVIVRTDPRVVHAECTYDNTQFAYTSTHTKRAKVQRRTTLAKITSPTEVTVQIVCNIDQFRAGDTVMLKLFGPADGVWLVGNCVRDVFLPYSELTLVQAMQPINAATGTPAGLPFASGPQASQPGAGTVIAAMISEAATLDSKLYPYVWGGGHGAAGFPSVGSPGGNGFDGHTQGFDCSGAVGAVLAAGGLMQWGGSVPGNDGIISQLLGANKILPGQGTGSPECTIFNYPGQHIFVRLNGKFFGSEAGNLFGSGAALPDTGAGIGWISKGSPGTAVPYYVPGNLLGQQAGGTGTQTPSTTATGH